MLTFDFSTFPVLTTERLILRQTTLADAEEVLFMRSDPRVLQYLDTAPCASLDEAALFIQKLTDNVNNNDSIPWAVTLKGEDTLIGSAAIWRIDKTHHRGEIGYTLHPDHQGKGLMHEALSAIIDYGFREMKLHSLEANINPANDASRKVLERLNFVQEAYFRENYYFNGNFTDSAIYSLITPVKD